MTGRAPRKESDEPVAMRPVPPPCHLIVEARRTDSTFGVVGSGYLVVLAADAPAAVRIVGGVVAAEAAVGVIGARSRAIRPRTISVSASTLRVGIRRIAASSIARATTQGDGDVGILVLGRGGLSAWLIGHPARSRVVMPAARSMSIPVGVDRALARSSARPNLAAGSTMLLVLGPLLGTVLVTLDERSGADGGVLATWGLVSALGGFVIWLALRLISGRRLRIEVDGPALLVPGRGRVPADRIIRGGIVDGPRVFLRLADSDGIGWLITLSAGARRIDAAQRDALVHLIEASAIDLPPVHADRYDPRGRFARVGSNAMTREQLADTLRAFDVAG